MAGKRRGHRAASSTDRRIQRGAALRQDLRQRLAAAALRQRVVTAQQSETQARRLERFREYRSSVAAAAAAAGSPAPRRRDDGDGRDGHAHRRAAASSDLHSSQRYSPCDNSKDNNEMSQGE